MFRKLVIASFACLLVIACSYFYFHFRQAKVPVSNALTAIPPDASFILETSQARSLFRKISESNIIWQDLVTTEFFSGMQKNLKTIDSLLTGNPAMAPLFEGTKFYISAHPTESGCIYLFSYALPDDAAKGQIEEFIQTKFNVRKQKSDIVVLSTTNRREVCFYAFSKGVLLISSSESLILKAIEQSKSPHSLLDDKNFCAAYSTAKSARYDIRFFCNYSQTNLFLNSFLSAHFALRLNKQGTFSGWTALDASVRPKSVVMTGFSVAKQDSDFLDLFRGQEPQTPEALSVMPSNTASFLYYGYSDFHSFYQNYSKHRSVAAIAFLDSVNNRYDADLATDFSSWTANETALVVTEPGTEMTDPADCRFVVLRSGTIDQSKNSLYDLCATVCKIDSSKTDTFSCGTHLIRQLKISGVLKALFGLEYNVQQNYFSDFGNYLIFGNSVESLKNYLRAIDADRTLNQDSHFNEFSTNLASKCNVYFYSNIARSRLLYKQCASPEYGSIIAKNTELLIRFEALGIQFSSQGNLFYNNVYLEENPIYKKETASLWETKLDTFYSGKPALLLNHMTNTLDIFVQDEGNKIYLISNTGKILWSRQLSEHILSTIHQVDGFKNKKLQILFNTRSSLYQMDRNGKDLEGFPVQLPSPATNAISVFDYDKSFDYRILVACADKRIRNYSVRGKMIDGWQQTETADTVKAPILHAASGGKDYILVADLKGQTYALDRHGEIRFRLKELLPAPLTSFWLVTGKDPALVKVLAADSTGIITRLSLGGQAEHLSFKPFGSRPWFLYHDLNADKSAEFIFLEGNELSVFSEDKSLLFSYTFNDTIKEPPFIMTYADHHDRIGIVSQRNEELYLINESGTVPPSFPLRGRTPFSIGNVNHDDTYLLITGAGKNIYAYSVP